MTSITDFTENRKTDTLTSPYAKADLLVKHPGNRHRMPTL
jgi:hypothetical protein